MKMKQKRYVQVVGAVCLSFVVAGVAGAQVQQGAAQRGAADMSSYPSSELFAGKWTAGSSVGMLGATPDGNAFAVNGNADYFVTERVSMGPLLQLGLTGDMTQIGLSGQGKYWITSPAIGGRGQLYLQSGVGFVHTDFRQDDTSWLVPLGVGFDYAITPAVSLTSAFLLNFTDLHTGNGTDADVMPGFAFGVRF
ncbi:MAG: hypothetical protein Q8R91_10945 [Candidatus Omnitrophota bacterium]|nr:hypothetical protein [Candidatus Omnitrophota bacterium]